jgi:hypothetical protein
VLIIILSQSEAGKAQSVKWLAVVWTVYTVLGEGTQNFAQEVLEVIRNDFERDVGCTD